MSGDVAKQERELVLLMPALGHEATCAYYGLAFKPGSANRICSCPGRVIPPASTD